MSVEITRWIEIDMGHRVPDHGSKCRNPHGHRYRIELTVTGPVRDERGNEEDGMVVDFAMLNDSLMKVIDEPYDHGFTVAHHDIALIEALQGLATHKVVVVGFPPTAERLAEHWGGLVVADLWVRAPWANVARLQVWETLKSTATWRP
jgi:6-pyruvoyltetrahydropterin/6-carboxytetrahydropterin synthase